MSHIVVHEMSYFLVTGRLKKLLDLEGRCRAKNQMWHYGRKRRNEFIAKMELYLIKRISKLVLSLGYNNWRLERIGSNNLYDVEKMQNQSYKIFMWEKLDE